MVVVKHWLCQPCCDGNARRVNVGIVSELCLYMQGYFSAAHALEQVWVEPFRLEGLENVLGFVPPLQRVPGVANTPRQ